VNRVGLRRILAIALVPFVGVVACSEDETDSAPPSTETSSDGATTDTTTAPTTTLGPYVSPLGDIVGEALTKNAQFTSLACSFPRADDPASDDPVSDDLASVP
jgi:hypothetical protein